ncbi:hypothetical protein HNY73_011714 [Argiope bruennichi]|uniref:Uncharacterized protein n=1 Tax=Argiope bruennichi TaxID=94029 RepID=A0A8T0EYW6_ARGBR|nr:hypothetical protein HNY73_011714 [Argiope bruennichi]
MTAVDLLTSSGAVRRTVLSSCKREMKHGRVKPGEAEARRGVGAAGVNQERLAGGGVGEEELLHFSWKLSEPGGG